MSYKTERYNLERHSNQSLAVTQCGLQICNGGHSCGPHLYSHYSIHFIISGKGTFNCGSKTHNLHAGQGFVIIPDIPNTCTADKNNPWQYIYAIFCGIDDKSLIHNAGLSEDNMTFDFEMTDDMMHNIKMMHSCSKNNEAKGYDVTGYFLLVMSQLVKSNKKNSCDEYMTEHYIRRAMSYIEDNYSENITVSSISSYVGIERTYLYKLFKKYIGISPTNFLISYRLERAKSMMEYDNLTVSKIASEVGFFDSSHFSGAFVKKYGITPGRYYKLLHE